jgi:hypothetical protein
MILEGLICQNNLTNQDISDTRACLLILAARKCEKIHSGSGTAVLIAELYTLGELHFAFVEQQDTLAASVAQ